MKSNEELNNEIVRLTAERDGLLAVKGELLLELQQAEMVSDALQSELAKAQELFEVILDDPRLVVAMSTNKLVAIKDFLARKAASAAKGGQL